VFEIAVIVVEVVILVDEFEELKVVEENALLVEKVVAVVVVVSVVGVDVVVVVFVTINMATATRLRSESSILMAYPWG
jgi:hypothetical protein